MNYRGEVLNVSRNVKSEKPSPRGLLKSKPFQVPFIRGWFPGSGIHYLLKPSRSLTRTVTLEKNYPYSGGSASVSHRFPKHLE